MLGQEKDQFLENRFSTMQSMYTSSTPQEGPSLGHTTVVYEVRPWART